MDPPPPPAPVKLSFGFGAKKPSLGAKPSTSALPKKKPIFAIDDDEPSPAPLASTSIGSKPRISTATLSKAQKAKQSKELELDSSVYEYDEVFDRMKEGSRVAELAKKQDAGERKPKYITKLMETAEQRKQDRVRAEDKMVQREREMEGEEFADKDAFVTPAYLAQQEEMRKLEEAERKKEAANKPKAGGISSFLKDYLDTTSKAHEAAVAASLSKDPTPSTSKPFGPSLPAPLSETELAAQVSAQTGRKIEVNDDGIIIDKRELLAGGLNIIAKRTAESPGGLGFSAPIKERLAAAAASSSSSSLLAPGGGLSAAERGRQSRERHSREVERQMMALETKRKRETEETLVSQVVKVAKRNDETKVEEMKRKAEERRLKREADLKAAANGP